MSLLCGAQIGKIDEPLNKGEKLKAYMLMTVVMVK